MSGAAKLERLLDYAASTNRICPQPRQWDDLWRLLGCPPSPPLILSGWAFSTDREKRLRFREHLEYASSCRLLDVADRFVRELSDAQWHTCRDDRLDWSYGAAIIEDETRRQQSISNAATAFDLAKNVLQNRIAFCRENLAETAFLYHLLTEAKDLSRQDERLREESSRFASLIEDPEFSLFGGVQEDIAQELRDVIRTKRTEQFLAEILLCMTMAGIALDRDSVEDFVGEMFSAIVGGASSNSAPS